MSGASVAVAGLLLYVFMSPNINFPACRLPSKSVWDFFVAQPTAKQPKCT